MDSTPVGCEVYRTSVPMRGFEHAAASRRRAEAVVVRLVLADGREGWGETHPRDYVTGETLDGVIEDLGRTLFPALVHAWQGAADAAALSAALPDAAEGRCLNAAVCALELAALQAVEFAGAPRGKRPDVRVSGVIGSSDPARTARQLRRMRWYGLRDFKLKLGFDDQTDAENLRLVHHKLARGLRRGKLTLRVDVNGGWPADEVPVRVAALRQYGVGVVEQPCFAPATGFTELARRCELPLMADESLLAREDAQALLAAGDRVWWSIRLSKNGGFFRAKALADLAAERGAPFTLGCMVGESGLLSAWQQRLLASGPRPRFVEGNYGRFLLDDDLTRPSPRIRYGGRLKSLPGPGLGVRVVDDKLAAHGRLVATLTA